MSWNLPDRLITFHKLVHKSLLYNGELIWVMNILRETISFVWTGNPNVYVYTIENLMMNVKQNARV